MKRISPGGTGRNQPLLSPVQLTFFSRFNTVVANRLSVIHRYTTKSQWLRVQSENNIAHLASRGMPSESQLRIW